MKLGAVASDVLGASGRDRLAALLAGEQDAAAMAELARGRLRAKLPALRQALEGRVTGQHRVLLRPILAHLDFLDGQLEQLTAEIEAAQIPFADAVALLQTIPGVAEAAASAILAEIGTDRTRFPSAAHLASWAGLCPGKRQSGGKRLSGHMTPGNRWLRAVLGEVAWSAVHMSTRMTPIRWPSLTASRADAATCAPVWRSLTASWSASIICCAPISPPRTWDRTTSSSSTTNGSNATTSVASSTSAMRSRSPRPRPPDQTRERRIFGGSGHAAVPAAAMRMKIGHTPWKGERLEVGVESGACAGPRARGEEADRGAPRRR